MEKLFRGDLPADGEHEKGMPIVEGNKVYAASKKQEDEMAAHFAKLGAPLKEDQIPVPKQGFSPDEPLVDASIEGQEGDWQAFELPTGEDLFMVMLHPERNEDGTVGEVPKVVLRSSCKEWDEWVRHVMKVGLTYGSVTDKKADQKLRGFVGTAEAPDQSRHRLSFLFSQCAAIVPFRDIDYNQLKHEKEREEQRKQAKELAAKKKRKAKMAAKSRKANR